MRLTRRSLIQAGMAATALPMTGRLAIPQALAQAASQPRWRHGMAMGADPAYPPGFAHFDYVNPDAPKGGNLRISVVGTFDNFNPVVTDTKGTMASGVVWIHEFLLAQSFDEPAAFYGLLAEGISYPDDVSTATFRLHANAKWHDGEPVTPEDVIFSFNAWKQSPSRAALYRHVTKAEKTGERDVTFSFDAPGNLELPIIVGQLCVLPKHWWEGADASGKKRDITATTLEPPLGSGPYRIKSFDAGRSLVIERVADYWGKDLNVTTGHFNLGQIRFDYFRDRTAEFQAFKGDQIDFHREGSAKDWATGYDFPAVQAGRVMREQFPIHNHGMMRGVVFNIRRDKFKDARLRQAFNLAYDFEEMNKQLFFGQYRRLRSYFDGTELAWCGTSEDSIARGAAGDVPATQIPEGLELEILEPVRAQVPPEVFTTPYTNPVGGSPEAIRANLNQAIRLLKEAGYDLQNRRLINVATGEPLTVEFLLSDPAYERVVLFHRPSLERLGITVSIRTVDHSQYQNRLRNRDYELLFEQWGQSLSPGNEQRFYWGSQFADEPGSRNLIGIKNPAVDKLINRVVFAHDRNELVAATRALDRVLLWNHYVVPQYYPFFDWTARWDRFSHPDKVARYSSIGSFPTIWWWDAAKAAKVG
jgi:microcin C transport system substrate-binding protein